MISNTFWGCIIFLTTNISLLYTAHLLVRRYLPDAPPSVRLVAIGILFYSLIILIFQALSPFHAISKTWVTICCLLTAMVSHFIWGKQRNLQADIEPVKLWIRDGLNSRWAALLIVCGFVVLLSFSRALLMPPLAWDCLTYHLTFATLWIQKGTLLLFKAPDQIISCGHLPINGEIFASWFLLPFHSDLLVNTMNFPITLLGGISCYAIARQLGLSRKEAGFVPALICFSPVVYSQVTTGYVDNAVFAFCSAAVLFTLRYLRKGYLHDGFLAFVAAGILLGIKYNAIPAVGLIVIAITIKTMRLAGYPGFFKKLGLILLGLIILCMFGGRKYIQNTIEAGNPLYPFPVKIFGHEIFESGGQIEQAKELVLTNEKKSGWDKFSLWETEYRHFFYLSLTAGPKSLLFLILALISPFIKPQHVLKRVWYFLSIIWIVPIFIYYVDTSTAVCRRGPWVDVSTRFLSCYIALFTIQGLVVMRKLSKYFKKIDFFLVVLVALDLFLVNKAHLWEVAVLYPFIVIIILLVIILWMFVIEKSKNFTSKEEALADAYGSIAPVPSRLSGIVAGRWLIYGLSFVFLVSGLNILQNYRDKTRYTYYHEHTDFHDFPRYFVNAWEFLDHPDEQKTIALTMNTSLIDQKWFFYPLLGRHLQNDIVYISAKHKGEVPTWLDRGLLRGDDPSIWLFNLREKKVDYILFSEPWPIELQWMVSHEDKFQPVFSDKHCKIFKYTGKHT